nr:LysR substrate-binding domain-containing protein [Herbaspirillum rubrisubalbicans]
MHFRRSIQALRYDSRKCLWAVAADEVDLGIAFHVARPNEEIDCETLLRERLSVVVGQHHDFFKRKRSITPQMLASERLCLLSAEFATRDHVDDYLRVQKVSPAIVIEANTIGALIEVVRRSTLVTILPEAIGEQHPDLRNIAISPAPKPRTAAILRRRDAYQSAAALAFTRLCRDFPA